MSSQIKVESPKADTQNNPKHLNRLKLVGILLTIGGICLFSYFVYSVGLREILEGVSRIGFGGFAIILLIYFLRICVRATAWKLSVYEPYRLSLKDTIPAVIIGEAMSSMIPLGILVSGTAKAVAVRKKIPLVVGLSSVATENLFYSIVTSLFIIFGAIVFLRTFELQEKWILTLDLLIIGIFLIVIFIVLMIIRQWHFASAICEKLYDKGFAKRILERGRLQVRLFENLIYGFYRRYPRRFVPIFSMQILFHLLGVLEAFFILSKILETFPDFLTAFLLETVSRLITVIFKLVPFLIGIDEAGAQFVTETLALGAGVGITLAIIRKGRILFWALVGVLLITKRGLSLKEISRTEKEFSGFVNL